MRTLSRIAATGDFFKDFGPYVPAISQSGDIAFQAATTQGTQGIFLYHRGQISTLSQEPFWEYHSHPAIADEGLCTFYATSPQKFSGLFLQSSAPSSLLLKGPPGAIGPLGPTISSQGIIAFRASFHRDGLNRAGIFTASQGNIQQIAQTGSDFASFQGLPVITERKKVLFRADWIMGGAGIYLAQGQTLKEIASTQETFSGLGRFPAIDAQERVVFAATLRAGGSGIFLAQNGATDCIIGNTDYFTDFRGALLSRVLYFFASTLESPLGIFMGEAGKKVLALGDEFAGATITDFAMNSVSINHNGQLALRIALSNGQQQIVRFDPEQIS